MSNIDRVNRIITIPYAGLQSVIFGIMLLSFPLGAYIIFNSDIGKEITYQFPTNGFNIFLGGISFTIPISFEIGDAFILAWIAFLVLFTISFLGPKGSFLRVLSQSMSSGLKNMRENGLVNMISWLSILLLSSEIIDRIQTSFGVIIESPKIQNDLLQFFYLTSSPLTEEIGFRILLIGIPLFLIYSQKTSIVFFLKTLWRPSEYLKITNHKKAIAIIIAVGIFFGVSHIISGNPWSSGKFAQAAISGIIIGWVYVRYGFAPAVLIHWSTNYFIFSYMYFISILTQTSVDNALSSSFSNTLEGIILVVGILSLTIKILDYIENKNRLKIYK